jgi:hypothetical protein
MVASEIDALTENVPKLERDCVVRLAGSVLDARAERALISTVR